MCPDRFEFGTYPESVALRTSVCMHQVFSNLDPGTHVQVNDWVSIIGILENISSARRQACR